MPIEDSFQLLAWYPGPGPLRYEQTRGISTSLSGKIVLAIITALVVNAASTPDQHGISVKIREGRHPGFESRSYFLKQHGEWIEAATELWPSAHQLNAAPH